MCRAARAGVVQQYVATSGRFHIVVYGKPGHNRLGRGVQAYRNRVDIAVLRRRRIRRPQRVRSCLRWADVRVLLRA